MGAWQVGTDVLAGEGRDREARIMAALKAYEGLGEPHQEERARWFLAHSLCGTGDMTLGEGLTARALGSFRELGDAWGTAAALTEAHDRHEQSRRPAAAHGFKAGEINAVLGLGARRAGDLDAAETHLRRVLDWHCEVGLDGANALLLAEPGFVAELRGEPERARELHESGCTTALATGDDRAVALALEGLADAHALAGRHADAARLLGTASAAQASRGAPLPVEEQGDVRRVAANCRAALGTSYEKVFAEGQALNPRERADGGGARLTGTVPGAS
ncbi:hypothetical protein GCM10010329_85370 [Streptomyces spiroverticillatus]|uniref:Tetratricopeptide repeat protein n=1 Tax=Streptomyces finlayi TaxID=67296 RepID=A0A918X9G0_9ACTN|nr:hypothetical protein [Streptomyces finlayi]GHA50240.1 hypothetical protein GCM10010329_85370 [Streptomyces spiroverticillatus]GHD19805.1 hypothetical protein GCM10010334_83760 [Streptomyces finlayi]